MLVLSRKTNESVLIDGDITLRVLSIKGTRVQIGIDAPDDVSIQRGEIVIDLQEEEQQTTLNHAPLMAGPVCLDVATSS